MRLLRNALANFVGGVVPAIASLLTVPVIVRMLGEEQYGLFALLTSIVGYFALLDINATAGSMKYLAEHHSRGDERAVDEVLSCGLLIYLAIGVIGGGALFFSAEALMQRGFKVPPALHDTALLALRVAAVAFLFGQLQTYLTSIPQALQRYDVSARYEAVFGSLSSVVTVITVLLKGGLPGVMAVRTALSVINCGLLVRSIRQLLPQWRWRQPSGATVRSITSFSAYAYLSRLASLTYQNADKLLIGAMVDLRSLAFYAVPFVLTNRVFGMVFRLGHVLFPLASALSAAGRHAELRHTYSIATRFITFLNGCLCFLLCVFARDLLHHWAGPQFGTEAATVLVLIATATFIDSLTNLPSLVNDGLGTPRNTGVLAVTRAALGLSGAWLGIKLGGIVGAAVAQAVVSTTMTLPFLVFFHQRILPMPFRELARSSYGPGIACATVGGMIGALRLVGSPLGVVAMMAWGAACAVVLTVIGWCWVLRPEDRERLLGTALRLRRNAV